MSDSDTNPYEAYVVGKSATRTAGEEREARRALSSVDVIQDVLDWFDYRIAHYDSLDAIHIDETTNLEDVKLGLLLVKKLKAAYETEASSFREEFKQYVTLNNEEDDSR